MTSSFPRPFRIGARPHGEVSPTCRPGSSRRHARLSTLSSSSALASTRGGRSATVGFASRGLLGRSCPRCCLKRSGSGGLFIQGCSPTTRPPASQPAVSFGHLNGRYRNIHRMARTAKALAGNPLRPPASRLRVIRDTVNKTECSFVTYSLCDLLRYRFDCVLDALDELRKLQGHPNAREEIEAWGVRTRAALRRVVGGVARRKAAAQLIAKHHARPEPDPCLQAAAKTHVPRHGIQDRAPPHAHGPPQALHGGLSSGCKTRAAVNASRKRRSADGRSGWPLHLELRRKRRQYFQK